MAVACVDVCAQTSAAEETAVPRGPASASTAPAVPVPGEKKPPQWNTSPEVFIHVYDLGHSSLVQRFNGAARRVGLFHSGVEVYGVEWHFGFCWEETAPGVTSVPPRGNEEHTYRETIPMGATRLERREVQELLVMLRKKWLGCSYDLFRRNCNHFTDFFCRLLGCGPAPLWIDGILASAGQRPDGSEPLSREFQDRTLPAAHEALSQDPVGRPGALRGFLGFVSSAASNIRGLARRGGAVFETCRPISRCKPHCAILPEVFTVVVEHKPVPQHQVTSNADGDSGASVAVVHPKNSRQRDSRRVNIEAFSLGPACSGMLPHAQQEFSGSLYCCSEPSSALREVAQEMASHCHAQSSIAAQETARVAHVREVARANLRSMYARLSLGRAGLRPKAGDEGPRWRWPRHHEETPEHDFDRYLAEARACQQELAARSRDNTAALDSSSCVHICSAEEGPPIPWLRAPLIDA